MTLRPGPAAGTGIFTRSHACIVFTNSQSGTVNHRIPTKTAAFLAGGDGCFVECALHPRGHLGPGTTQQQSCILTCSNFQAPVHHQTKLLIYYGVLFMRCNHAHIPALCINPLRFPTHYTLTPRHFHGT